jgi:RND family efflux transporter MFP subunit
MIGNNGRTAMKIAKATLSLIIISSLAISTFGLLGCGKDEVETKAPVVRPVKTIVVGGAFTGRRTFPGTVQAQDRVNLSFRVSGPLIELPVDEGMEVTRGQLLGRIDPRDFQIELNEAKASFDKAESDYKRYQRLYEREAVPLSDLELHRAQRDVAKARMEVAESNLEYTYLRAPFAGRIGERLVENFEEVKAQQTVITLNDASTVEVVVDVPEQMMANIRMEGVSIDVFAAFEAAPGNEYPLEFREVSTTADPRTRTYRVTLMMPQPEEITVLSGMTAEVILYGTLTDTTDAMSTFVVPASAVGTADDGTMFVWVVNPEDSTVSARPVTVGSIAGKGGISVQSGLNQGDRICVVGVTQLREGAKVRPME